MKTAFVLLALGACTATPELAVTSFPSQAFAPAAFRFVDDKAHGALQLFDGDTLVLAYRYGDQLPEGVPANRTRSSYVHPICGLDGKPLTDDFPKDHYHHRGLSLMWPRMEVRGKVVELWHIKGLRALFREWLTRRTGRDVAVLKVGNDWKLSGGDVVATETLTLTVHRADDAGRAIDVHYRIEPREAVAVQGAIGKGYGGLNLRFGPRRKDSTVLTTETGLQKKDSDKQKFQWADLSANFTDGDRQAGIAIFQHASHPDFPAPWTLRHYGDLNVAWPGIDARTLKPSEPVDLRYRLWVHRGDADSGHVAEQFERYRDGDG